MHFPYTDASAEHCDTAAANFWIGRWRDGMVVKYSLILKYLRPNASAGDDILS